MKNYRLTGGILAVLTLLTLAACSTGASADGEPAEPDIIVVDEETGSTSVDETVLAIELTSYPAGDLTAEEAAGLLYMREEEKLAHDVYVTLYDLWGLPIFQNIASSEQTHTEAVAALIDRYGLEDPATGTVGTFTDPDLQSLYDQLVDTGSGSLESALRVGAAIEEIDILDIEERIAQTDHGDIALVYENLMQGSRNHLRAFVSTLERQAGETYVPQYLDQASYDEIVGTGVETGGSGRGGAGNAGGRGRGSGRGN
jgi:hypothetical protein